MSSTSETPLSSSATTATGQTGQDQEHHQHVHGHNITFTFPIVVITNPPPTTTSGNNNNNGGDANSPQQDHSVDPTNAPGFPEFIHHAFDHFLRHLTLVPGMPGQYEPIPSSPPKKHATQSAYEKLKSVEVKSLPEGER